MDRRINVEFDPLSMCFFVLGIVAIGSCIESLYEKHNDRLENETAMKSGLVQKYDKDANKVIWTKP